MKIQSKLALVLFSSFLMIILLFGFAIYFFQNNYSYKDFYKRLETRASIVAKYRFDSDRSSAENIMALREQHLEKLTEEKEYIIPYNNSDDIGKVAAQYRFPGKFLKEIKQNNIANLKIGNTLYSGIKYQSGLRNYFVIISAENYYSSHHLSFLRNILLSGILLISVITVFFSFYFSKRIFNPIKSIINKVKQISTESMHLRLETVENNQEMTELTNTFNDLFNRIETAFEIQKNFISNASHELRTPLTSIIGESELALNKNRTEEEYRETLSTILRQAERLDKITQSLLFIAQTGYKEKKIQFPKVRIDEIIWSAKEIMDNLNPNNQIIIDLSLLPEDPKKLKVYGNRELLQLAIANILNNACKYSNNNVVNLSLAAGNNHVVIIVKDYGIGIPENEIGFIYDPFFRASNTTPYEGYGIGLPLTRNVILLHKGELKVSSDKEGTTVQMNIPIAE